MNPYLPAALRALLPTEAAALDGSAGLDDPGTVAVSRWAGGLLKLNRQAATWRCPDCNAPVEPVQIGCRWLPRPCCSCLLGQERHMQSRLLYASQQADNERQQERLQFLRRCGLADGMTFQTWQQDTPARRKAAAWARRLTQRIAAGLWSYWHGPYGCGKTHLANAIATELVLEHGIGVRVVNWMVQLRAVQQSWSDNGIQEGPLWDLMIKPHALFLDDFDKQLPRLVDLDKPQVRLPASWYMESLYYVIEMRTAAKRPTVLIANQPLADIVTVLQAVGGTAVDAVFSRFSRAGSITIDWSQTGLTEFVRPAELPEF